jgi:hypothetical protein
VWTHDSGQSKTSKLDRKIKQVVERFIANIMTRSYGACKAGTHGSRYIQRDIGVMDVFSL